jgi:hypothetical protein
MGGPIPSEGCCEGGIAPAASKGLSILSAAGACARQLRRVRSTTVVRGGLCSQQRSTLVSDGTGTVIEQWQWVAHCSAAFQVRAYFA